ncbi:MAG: hypothetical protein L0209_04920 [candidate division Zixibacteria bacterium]|nr:hypothetical protein [candidate division Zixibacteria bacterium]
MSKSKAAFVLFGLFLVSSPGAFAGSPPEGADRLNQSFNLKLEILAETVWVNVKNRQAVTKVLLVVKNPDNNPLATGFRFPFTEKDTVVDFGLSRRSAKPLGSMADSSPPLAALDAFAENPDSVEPHPSGFQLAPGETAAVLLVYQTALGGENQSRYVFPLKESFKTKGAIRSFAFLAGVEEKDRIMEVKTENYPIVVRGNGPKRRAYFYQNNLFPKADIGFSYRVLPAKPKAGP